MTISSNNSDSDDKSGSKKKKLVSAFLKSSEHTVICIIKKKHRWQWWKDNLYYQFQSVSRLISQLVCQLIFSLFIYLYLNKFKKKKKFINKLNQTTECTTIHQYFKDIHPLQSSVYPSSNQTTNIFTSIHKYADVHTYAHFLIVSIYMYKWTYNICVNR